MNSKFSIIMPCHNGAKYIADSIRSVIAQIYTDWELIVIDDCSTDNSVEIVQQLAAKDSRIKLLKTEHPSGSPTLPRNIGIENAQGRFIAFLDCDDMWLPTKLENQLPLLENEKTAIAFSYYEKMDESGKRDNRIVRSPSTVTYSTLLKGNCIGNLTGVYDTIKVGKVLQKYIRHEDYVMWLQILNQGWIAQNTNSCEAVYREQKNSVSGNKLHVLCWVWNIYTNELKLSFLQSIYYFAFYMVKSILKFLK